MSARSPSFGAPGLARHGDLLLAGLVVGVVAMMIIPLPTWLLDLLLTTNISIGVLLLLVSIYVADAVRIAAFPSILLVTTLFRLGLNVSSTRLILSQADAGTVIYSFGNFVVGGNVVVGAVVFLILTLIQFVVIAKGSERVAEVAARFTLDAMPGRQMAIDADVRTGAIDMDEARRLRAGLQRESQLYGAMDGAMKYVKGDAIAGIIITLINIVGGLLIGVLQRGMSVGDAVQLYSVLTVGDGLVSQIPALLISTAAGMVVTRVASEQEGSHLGGDIGAQILAQPKAMLIASGLLVLLALVPGLPTLPFLLLGVGLGAVGYRSIKRASKREGRAGESTEGEGDWMPASADTLPATSAVALEVGADLVPYVDTERQGRRLMTELIPGLRELLHTELGIVVPGIHVRRAGDIGARVYRIALADTPVATGEVDLDGIAVVALPEHLSADGFEGVLPLSLPGLGGPVSRISAAQAPALAGHGLETVDPATQMVLHLGQVLRLHAGELVGIQETQQLLDRLERTHPTLVHEVVPKLLSVTTLSEVLRRLVEERISIRDLRAILQALVEWAGTEKDPVVLAEYVRMGLRRYISHRYAGSDGRLRALLLDPALDDAIRQAIQRTAKGSYLALEPDLAQDITRAVQQQLDKIETGGPRPVVLTSADIRRYVRRLLEQDFDDVAVLSFNELVPAVRVDALGSIAVTPVFGR